MPRMFANPRRTTYQLSTPNLGLNLMRATEAAAMAAGAWAGRGDKEGGDKAAVDAMRAVLNEISMNGTVIIGEGEKDKAPMLHNGERLGTGAGSAVDIAVDPVEGTTLLAQGQSNAISVLATADRGTMYDPSGVFYMDKLVVGPGVDPIELDAPIKDTIAKVAKARGIEPADVTVGVLDRDRHQEMIAEIRKTDAKIRLFRHGDVAISIAAIQEGRSCDMMAGIGGTPEGVITACAVKAMGGQFLARLWPENDEEREHAQQAGHDPSQVLSADDLVSGNTYFVATGITDGDLLPGVSYFHGGARTHSIVMRSRSGTVRHVESVHRTDKVQGYTPD